VEALVVDAEVMAHLMQHRLTDLQGKVARTAGHPEVFLSEDADPVGSSCEVVHAPILQHHTLVEPEESLSVLSLFGRWFVLHNDVEVVDLLDDPFRQLVEHQIDNAFKCSQVAA